MKINEEIFLKYLSDLLTENEKREFEKYLMSNPKTQQQFNEYQNKLNSLIYKPEVDERYFNAVLPKVKLQLNKSGNKYYLKFAYGIPILILLIYIGFNLINKTKMNFNENKELNLTLFTDSEELANELFTDFYMTETISLADDNLAVIAQEEYEKSLSEENIILVSDDNIFENSIFNDYSEYLTEQELNSIFLKLENKNKL
jgi:hypothetical protein